MEIPRDQTAACALVTGASAGLGAEFSRQLAHRGYHLVLTARRLDRLEALAADLKEQFGIAVTCISADLSKDEGIRQVEEYVKTLTDLEILVNNAGYGMEGSFEQSPVDETLRMIQVHVNASARLTHAALPGMRRRKIGYVINVSSMSAFLPFGNVAYSATKAFLVNFSQALETGLAGSGVHVQALCPGFTYTEFHDSPGLSGIRQKMPSWLWMNKEAVVQDSLNHLKKNRVIVIPGLVYKLAYLLTRLPLFSDLVNKMAGKNHIRRK